MATICRKWPILHNFKFRPKIQIRTPSRSRDCDGWIGILLLITVGKGKMIWTKEIDWFQSIWTRKGHWSGQALALIRRVPKSWRQWKPWRTWKCPIWTRNRVWSMIRDHILYGSIILIFIQDLMPMNFSDYLDWEERVRFRNQTDTSSSDPEKQIIQQNETSSSRSTEVPSSSSADRCIPPIILLPVAALLSGSRWPFPPANDGLFGVEFGRLLTKWVSPLTLNISILLLNCPP